MQQMHLAGQVSLVLTEANNSSEGAGQCGKVPKAAGYCLLQSVWKYVQAGWLDRFTASSCTLRFPSGQTWPHIRPV